MRQFITYYYMTTNAANLATKPLKGCSKELNILSN